MRKALKITLTIVAAYLLLSLIYGIILYYTG